MRFNLLSLFVILLALGCKPSGSTGKADAAKETSGNPLTAPVDYLGAVGAAQKVAQKTTDLALVNQAIQSYAATEGHYPADLDELVAEKYLISIPKAPKGYRYEYLPGNGQIKVTRQ